METTANVAIDREMYLESLMARYQAPVLRMCRAYLSDRQLAEDATQETFVKAYRAMDTFRGESDEKTWLMRIAINTCKDMRRGAWFRYVDRSVTPENLPAPAYEGAPGQNELADDILRLPRKELTVVLLHYYQGMTTREVQSAAAIRSLS